MPTWQEKPQITDAVAEYKKALEADPFVGAVAIDGLSRVITLVNALRVARQNPAEAGEFIAALSNEGADAAETAGNDTYTQLFEAASEKWSAPAEVAKKAATPKQAPTATATTPMSSAKS